ncbi:MAG: hypothetical protein JWO38_3102 [Gemmataceae bacterium]|nr:hypothetical protein [Gemmataceae bacterium]
MKKIVIAAALAVAGVCGPANRADAQIFIGVGTPSAWPWGYGYYSGYGYYPAAGSYFPAAGSVYPAAGFYYPAAGYVGSVRSLLHALTDVW